MKEEGRRMSSESNQTGATELSFEQIVEEFRREVEAGRRPAPSSYLERFPQFAERLRAYFIEIGQLAAPAAPQAAHTQSTGLESADGTDTKPPAARKLRKRQTLIPKVLDRYRLQRLLGRGAMGVVFLAEDTQVNRRVALKIPAFDLSEDPVLRERFYREARAAALVRHPNICPVYAAGEAEGFQFIAMAYIAGVPLSRFVNRDNPLAFRKAAVVIKKLALALQEAHDAGIVHRDLKPANIMVSERGEPVVMDFGLARLSDAVDNVRVTQTGAIIGSPAYMSPEQVTADHKTIGPASDIYGLGVVFYELLTGHLPFTGNGQVMALVAQILRDQAPSPLIHRAGIPRDLESICLKMLAKSPTDRPASMRQVASLIADYLAGRSAVADPQTPTTEQAAGDTDAVAPFLPAEITAARASSPNPNERSLEDGDSGGEASEMERSLGNTDAVPVQASAKQEDSQPKGAKSSVLATQSALPLPFPKLVAIAACLLVVGLAFPIIRGFTRTTPPTPSPIVNESASKAAPVSTPTAANPPVANSPETSIARTVQEPTAEAITPAVASPTSVAAEAPKLSAPATVVTAVPVATTPVPTLELRSAPHRSSYNGGILLHLGIRNWKELGLTNETVAKIVDQSNREIVSPWTSKDFVESNGQLIIALPPREMLPQRVQLTLSTVDKRPLFQSEWVDIRTLSGIESRPISLVPHATRGLLDDFAKPPKHRISGDNLAELKIGSHILDGIQFQVEDAVVDLRSSVAPRLPPSRTGLRTGQSVAKLHLLLSCFNTVDQQSKEYPAAGTQLAHCLVHYADQSTATIPLRYGHEVGGWLSDHAKTSLSNGSLAWVGANSESRRDTANPRLTHLYRTTWINPQPDQPIESFDLVSDDREVSIVCVAISAESPNAKLAEETIGESGAIADVASTAWWGEQQRDVVVWALEVGGSAFLEGNNVPFQKNLTMPVNPTVQRLVFVNCNLADRLDRLASCWRLRSLKLDRTETTSDGLQFLKGLPLLRDLTLNNNPITDDGLTVLTTLPQLDTLEVEGAKITPAGLAALRDCPNLRQISLRKNLLTDEGFRHLQAIPKLTSLKCDADDETLKRLPDTLALTDLVLEDTRIAPVGLSEIARIKSLRRLELVGIRLSTNAIARFSEFDHLTELRVWGVTPSELSRLKKMLPNCKVSEMQTK